MCASTDVAGLVVANLADWERLLGEGVIRPGRPDDHTWSSLEYACHVRDVYLRYDGRLTLMLDAEDPLFPNWDQDATAVDDRYDEQNPFTVVGELRDAGATVAQRLASVDGVDWDRKGRRSDGASFTLDTIARYMVHDTIHHVWDVTARD